MVALLGAIVFPVTVFGSPVSDAVLSRTAQKYNTWAESIRTIRGGGKARVGFADQETRGFRFALAVERPHHLRFQGRLGPTASLFDLGADDQAWTLYLPQQREVVRAQDPQPAGPLGSPRDLVLALLPQPVILDFLRSHGAATQEGSLLRLVVPPREGSPYHRVLWLNVATGLPSKIILRAQTQLEEPMLVVEFAAYTKKDDTWVPLQVRVESEEMWGTLEFSSFKLNDTLDPRRFKVRVPTGVTELAPESLNAGFLPVDDAP